MNVPGHCHGQKQAVDTTRALLDQRITVSCQVCTLPCSRVSELTGLESQVLWAHFFLLRQKHKAKKPRSLEALGLLFVMKDTEAEVNFKNREEVLAPYCESLWWLLFSTS